MLAEGQCFFRVVCDPHPREDVRPSHDSEANPTGHLGHLFDLRDRIVVRVDDVVEEAGRKGNDLAELVPVNLQSLDAARARSGHENLVEVDRPEIAGLVRKKRLLATGIGRLDLTEGWRRVLGVDLVDEDHSRVAGLVRAARDVIKERARVELTCNLARMWVDQFVVATRFECFHEGVCHGQRDVEVLK